MKDLESMKSFLFTFWQTRNPADPETAWRKYMEQVAYTDSEFGSRVKRGWQTDRGRVYLQYGKPNTRIERPNNPDYYPFEIWHYYETNGMHNCKFLFYNPSLSGDYELINTENLPMEVKNADWKRMVKTGTSDSVAGVGREGFNQKDRNTGDELEELWYNPH
jgi:GWxTD domain-containing protein